MSSKWFTRGWTLQELLAPYYVDFFDRNWIWIGSKASLDDSIKTRTGILDFLNYKTASVAQKMSWASWRETTRIEDQAYCLLGLFGVHMPPLYGEGENAFIRLQLEILSKTDDDSIFAWNMDIQFYDNHGFGMLALSPKHFSRSGSVSRAVWDTNRPPHTMSSKGICVHPIPTKQGTQNRSPFKPDFLAPLNCTLRSPDGSIDHKKVVALRLYQSEYNNWYREPNFQMIDINPLDLTQKERTMVYVPQTSQTGERLDGGFIKSNQILISIASILNIGWQPKEYSAQTWGTSWDVDRARDMLVWNYSINNTENVKASITLDNGDLQEIGLVLGISKGRPWIDIVVLDTGESLEQILKFSPPAKEFTIGRDRISRPFLHGSLNGRLKIGSSPHEAIAEVTFDPDGKLRWPVRNIRHNDNQST